MPLLPYSVRIETHDTFNNVTTAIYSGITVEACINQAKALPNFKHIVCYEIITYDNQPVTNPVPVIHTF